MSFLVSQIPYEVRAAYNLAFKTAYQQRLSNEVRRDIVVLFRLVCRVGVASGIYFADEKRFDQTKWFLMSFSWPANALALCVFGIEYTFQKAHPVDLPYPLLQKILTLLGAWAVLDLYKSFARFPSLLDCPYHDYTFTDLGCKVADILGYPKTQRR